MATISIDGRTYSGSSFSIDHGRIVVDGIDQTPDQPLRGKVTVVVVEGAIQNLTTDASVNAGHVTGDVQAGGSVNCSNVAGSVTAGGSVNCDTVGGSITAGGSVRHG